MDQYRLRRIIEEIDQTVEEVEKLPKERATAIAVTKLQEASLWLSTLVER
jgi:hypothetical protein